MASKILFGQSDNITVFQADDSDEITRIYIDNADQFAPNEYKLALDRLGQINPVKNSDYQESISRIFQL